MLQILIIFFFFLQFNKVCFLSMLSFDVYWYNINTCIHIQIQYCVRTLVSYITRTCCVTVSMSFLFSCTYLLVIRISTCAVYLMSAGNYQHHHQSLFTSNCGWLWSSNLHVPWEIWKNITTSGKHVSLFSAKLLPKETMD